MMRPIDPLHVLRELDAMVAVISPPLPNAQREQARQAARRPARAASPARRSGDGPLPTPPAAPPRTRPTGREALVVDDSEVAQRFLELKLQRWGLRTERAADSATAIELMTKRPFDFVFLDVELGQSSALDGLALCHHINRAQRLPEGRRLPVVTLVSAHATEIDRVRGALAGADAYLGKPLDDNALAEVMVSHGVFAPGTEGLR
jgi:CheY-like chemotaxis protein